MSKAAKAGARLRAGVEIAADRVIAARAENAGHSIAAAASRSLPSGALTPSLTSTNIHDTAAVTSVLRDALSSVSDRARDVAVILPDAVSRISLLDFDTLPERNEEAEGVIRFRLKKSLPFDVDRAALSYDVQRHSNGIRVVAAVAVQSVVDEYEAVLREAGYLPGLLVPSTASALRLVETNVPTLLLKIDVATATLAIASRGELLLYRTIESGSAAPVTADQLADDVYASMVFFEDTYGTSIERVLVGGVTAAAVVPALESATGIRAEELVTASAFSGVSHGDRAAMSGLVGALIGE